MSDKTQGSARSRSLWESYKVLPARTRLYVSMAVCTIGAVGIFISDHLEERYPAQRPAQA
ncbi:hypothetical protein JVU11DRAFT_4903 [Chiua virens]|nr:hypothetical protein JVU11DRAFT_4903 [Chiua virens]